jgi:hypothetical protein
MHNLIIDDNAIIIGELITEIKIPNVLSELIASYLTPSFQYKLVLNELNDFLTVLLDVDGIDPSPTDIIDFINIIKSN